jgi:hypothetical protein
MCCEEYDGSVGGTYLFYVKVMFCSSLKVKFVFPVFFESASVGFKAYPRQTTN